MERSDGDEARSASWEDGDKTCGEGKVKAVV